jgi:Lipopolysaccharide biosynthesis proteins, LPS:glycosyltransferases
MEIIPVFFTFNRNYLLAAEVAIFSMLQNASPKYEYRLYVLHTDISETYQKELMKPVNKFKNASLEFIDTSLYDDNEEIMESKSHYSKEIYYKLIASEIFLMYDRIICSDVDVAFTGDISESFFMFKDEFFYFAGVGQILNSGRMKSYEKDFTSEEIEILKKEICAGYLLMNLDAIRKNKMQSKLTSFYKENYKRLRLPEQDCIILCCWPDIRYLPVKYGIDSNFYSEDPKHVSFFRGNDYMPEDHTKALAIFAAGLKSPVQVHYIGVFKPWNSFFASRQQLWFHFLYKSGCFSRFIKDMPKFATKRLKRYSFKRFVSKINHRFLKSH